jgi:hypothetical protein
MVMRDTQLKRKSFTIIVSETVVRITISILRVDGEIEGWVLMLDTQESLKEID